MPATIAARMKAFRLAEGTMSDGCISDLQLAQLALQPGRWRNTGGRRCLAPLPL